MTGAWVPLLAVAAWATAVAGLRLLGDPSPSARRLVTAAAVAVEPPLRRLRRRLGQRLAPAVLRTHTPARRRRIERLLLAAGRPGRMGVADVAAVTGADVVVCTVIGVGATTISPVLLPLVVGYGYLREELRLRGLARARQARIERDLPDFLDVLVVTIQAGLGFRSALRRVGEELDSPVSEEFRTALQQLDVGASRRDAFEGIRDRTDSPSMNRFVGALLQAEELGAPLTDAMAGIAADVRAGLAAAVRRRAATAVPRVTLVATVLLMPASALLLIGGLLIGGDVDLGGALGG